jgi:hypothetical protein
MSSRAYESGDTFLGSHFRSTAKLKASLALEGIVSRKIQTTKYYIGDFIIKKA